MSIFRTRLMRSRRIIEFVLQCRTFASLLARVTKCLCDLKIAKQLSAKMMKPKNYIVNRYRKDEEDNTSKPGSPEVTTPRRHNESRGDVNKNKKRIVPDSTDYDAYKTAIEKLESDKNKFREKFEEEQKKSASLIASSELKDKEMTILKKSVEALQKQLNKLTEEKDDLVVELNASEEQITSWEQTKQKLKQKNTQLQSDIRKLKVRNEKNDKLLQTARQLCKETFNSKIHPNFVRANLNLITEVEQLYESYSHGDKIQHCPGIQYMKSVPEPITSPWHIEDIGSNDGPPSKKMKMDDSIIGIDKHYSQSSLEALVMNLESKHSDKYDLWRNVLWALNQYGRERGYDTLKIANRFSKRSSKYKNSQDVKKTFQSSDGTLSLQYLIEMSKIYEEDLNAMTEYLSTILPARYSPLTINSVDIRDRQEFRINVNYANESHTLLIIPDLCILGNEEGKRICFLEKKITSKISVLTSLCPEMRQGFVVTLNKKLYEFRPNNNSSIRIGLHRPLQTDESYITLPNGKRDDKQCNLTEIRKALREESLNLLSAKSGKKFADDKDDYDMFKVPKEDSRLPRTDAELVDALVKADPNTMSRYCYSRNIIYYCKASTNLWCTITEMDLDSHLRTNLKTALRLNKAELKYIGMSHSIVRIRNMTISIIDNNDFPGLDSNLHLFMTKNKTIVASSIPPIIRNIERNDLAATTCGWSYNRELSKKHMESVQSYFHKLIPRQSEREWFLSFVAKMLNAQKRNEFFLVLTHKRGNKNGKKKLMSLLATLFGNYFISSTTTVVARGIRSNNEYDGGICNLKGKRLLVADGLHKTHTLNCDFAKSITNQSAFYIQDKKKYSRNPVTFLVQAGLIMSFAEDDVPKFDKTDDDFVKRMVAFPMRSRFLSEQEIVALTRSEENMTNIHTADDKLESQFPEWRSALLDLLISYYNESLPPISDSMVACTKRLCDENYDYYDWLNLHVHRAETNKEFITATDIMTKITHSSEDHNSREMAKLKMAMTRWAEENGFRYKPRHVYTVGEKKRTEAKSAIMNSVFYDVDEE